MLLSEILSNVVYVQSFSCVQFFATTWTVAHQAPLSMGFSRQEYWSGLPFPSLGDLPKPGIKPRSPALQADALTSGPLTPKYCNPFLLPLRAKKKKNSFAKLSAK